MMVQRLVGPSSLAAITSQQPNGMSIFSYNVMLPNSKDGWWMYKMYNPPLSEEQKDIASWEHRKALIQDRVKAVDAQVVCFQEVAPESFEEDFSFMEELGYDGKEMFKKGRFRPATFWKNSSNLCLAAPPVHKDRTLLTAFTCGDRNWYVLNCHLQAANQAPRRVRQINEGMRSVLTLARKLKETDPEHNLPVLVCGDFNGGQESGAIHYLEKGFIDETFMEDGAPVSSGRKEMPLAKPMLDSMSAPNDRPPPPTMVVRELISLIVEGDPDAVYQNPNFTQDMIDRLTRIHSRLSSEKNDAGEPIMNAEDAAAWLTKINGKVGRGSEFREAIEQMTVAEDCNQSELEEKPSVLPPEGKLTLEGFLAVYLKEMREGKFWGVAYDMAILGEPLADAGTFEARYDRLYSSAAVTPVAVVDFTSKDPCPNEKEPSDHLPIAAAFKL